MPAVQRFFRGPIALILSILTLSAPLGAAVIQVNADNDAADINPADGICDSDAALPGPQCTLRAAVMTAEANGEADLITIPLGFEITLDLSGDGGAELGDLDIQTDMEISGFTGSPPNDPTQLPQVSAFSLGDRIFEISGGQVTLRGLRLQGGVTDGIGGGVYVRGSASVGIQFSNFLNHFAFRGGAIFAGGESRLVVEDSNFIRNDADFAGGAAIAVGVGADASIRRSSFVDNRSQASRATLEHQSSGTVEVVNCTFHGEEILPPIPDRSTANGILYFGEGELIVRNTTIIGHALHALRLLNLDGDETVRVSHSILNSQFDACTITGADPSASDVVIEYSLLGPQTDCSQFVQGSGLLNASADLGNLVQDPPPRLTFSRPPSGLDSNVVEGGYSEGNPFFLPPELECAAVDQRGNPRPQDADADGEALCDLGAVEEGPPTTFVVDYFDLDLLDSNPGDGQCTTLIVPGVGSVCTLRAAVMETNALPGLQRILFEASDSPAVLTQASAAGAVGGDLNITDRVAIEGRLVNGRPVTVIENQVNNDRIFHLQAPDVDVYLRNLVLTGGGTGTGSGGALLQTSGSATASRLEMRNNFAGAGGGAVAVIDGRLHIEDSDLHSNTTLGSGAAALVTDGELVLTGSSVRDHLGLLADGSPSTSLVALEGALLAILNSTISGNRNGIRADRPGILAVISSTVAGNLNSALELDVNANTSVELLNSLFVDSGAAMSDCVISNLDSAEAATIDYLLSSDGSCAAFSSNAITADPRLLPLDRPDGQLSYSHQPSRDVLDPSPALDVAPANSCLFFGEQYGRARAQDLPEIPNVDGPCDLGSLEAPSDRLFRDRFRSLLP
jgi:hypothetical protein